jgi:hypothetical protein
MRALTKGNVISLKKCSYFAKHSFIQFSLSKCAFNEASHQKKIPLYGLLKGF